MISIYVLLSAFVAMRLVKIGDEKKKALKKINIYLTVKLFANFVMAFVSVLTIGKLLELRSELLILLPAVLSFLFSTVDSMVLYNPIKKLRDLNCSRKEYYKQIMGDNIILYSAWIAASVFIVVNKMNKSDHGYMVAYFLFWCVFNFIMVVVRKYTMKCTKCTNPKLVKAVEKYNLEGYKVYEYDGRSRKTANAMVDSFLGMGNIYFSDYLLNNMNAEEIEAVFLHEVGHIKKHHIIIRNILLIFIMPIMYCLGVAMDWIEQFHHINIPLGILFGFGVMISYMVFLYLYISRMQEYSADGYAADRIGNRENLCNALIKLNELNDVLENGKKNGVLRTHPTLAKRLERIRERSI